MPRPFRSVKLRAAPYAIISDFVPSVNSGRKRDLSENIPALVQSAPERMLPASQELLNAVNANPLGCQNDGVVPGEVIERRLRHAIEGRIRRLNT